MRGLGCPVSYDVGSLGNLRSLCLRISAILPEGADWSVNVAGNEVWRGAM